MGVSTVGTASASPGSCSEQSSRRWIGLALFRYIGPFLFAIFLYYAARPLYRQLDRVIGHPNVTTTATILFVILPMIAVVAYAAVVGLRELDQLLAASDLEAYRSTLEPYLQPIRQGNIGELRDAIGSEAVARLRARFDRASQEPSVDCCRSPARCSRSSPDSFSCSRFSSTSCGTTGNCVGGSTRDIDHDDDIVSYTQAVDDDLETVFLSNLAVILVAATRRRRHVLRAQFRRLGRDRRGDAGVALPAHRDRDADPGRRDENRLRPLRVGSPRRRADDPEAALASDRVLRAHVRRRRHHPRLLRAVVPLRAQRVHMGLVLLGYFLGTLAFGWWGCSSVRSSSSSRSTSGRRSSPDSRAISSGSDPADDSARAPIRPLVQRCGLQDIIKDGSRREDDT